MQKGFEPYLKTAWADRGVAERLCISSASRACFPSQVWGGFSRELELGLTTPHPPLPVIL